MTLDMTFLAFAVVIVIALAIGALVQVYMSPKTAYEWVITAAGVALGAWFASELTWTQWFTNTDFGPTWEGILIVPAVIGGLILGAIFEIVARAVEPERTLTPA